MDKKYQDVHLYNGISRGDEFVLRKCMITCISFTENVMLIHMKDDVEREQIMILPKLKGYKLIID